MPQKAHILVVHGSHLTREYFVRALSARGFRVTSHGNGRTALQALLRSGRRAPHAILCGLSLPDMTGLSFISRLRSLPRTPHTALLLLSAFANAGQIVRAFDTGAHDLLSQEMDIDLMAAKLSVHTNAVQTIRGLAQRLHLTRRSRADKQLSASESSPRNAVTRRHDAALTLPYRVDECVVNELVTRTERSVQDRRRLGRLLGAY